MKNWKILFIIFSSLAIIGIVIVLLLPAKKLKIENQSEEISKDIKTDEAAIVAQNLNDEKLNSQEIASENVTEPKVALLKVEIPEEKKPEEKKNVENIPVEKTTLEKNGVKSNLVSWGFQKGSGRSIDTIIIHTTYNALGGDPYDFTKVLQEWKDYGVAPHYAIDREGKIYQLVSDQNIAYHAGAGKTPDGRSSVNNFSLGIEVVNTEKGKFTDSQYSALNSLISNLKSRYKIRYILGHNEIASGRKTDPWGIEWDRIKK